MNILQINSANFGSTGNIMLQIKSAAEKKGINAWVAYPKSRSNRKKNVEDAIEIGTIIERNIHLLLAELTGFNGCFSKFATKRFLKKVSELKPDIIHLHNLHNCYINLPMLFKYIKNNHIPVVWTLHDCWSFTGQCPYFTMARCDKWRTGCHDCAQYRMYPKARVDRTKKMWNLKRKWFTEVDNMTIITPSKWLAELVAQSYLGKYSIKVINNGIDLSVFCPQDSNFREKYGIEDKNIILGVAGPWSKRKGLDVFLKLEKRLDKEKYQIVLVGTSEEDDKNIPKSIISIHRTNNQQELAKIYSAADVLAQTTKEENYPTVNMEALACGTPVVTFNTGGSSEMLNLDCGMIVPTNDVDEFEKAIYHVCEEKPFKKENCLKQSNQFDMFNRFDEYIELYERIINE